MIAMKYAFVFPDDFDMAVIRRRVADKGRLFDTYPGLLRKAFLATDRRADNQAAPAGASNSYATFYLWSSARAAADFLGGPDFAAVSKAFGRPSVRFFAPLSIIDGYETAVPSTAVSSIATVAAKADLAAEIAAQRASLRTLRGRPGFHSGILSLDSASWSIVRFTLWSTAASAETAANGSNTRYEVLHLSTPVPGIPLVKKQLATAG
jgi:hypothetical protein